MNTFPHFKWFDTIVLGPFVDRSISQSKTRSIIMYVDYRFSNVCFIWIFYLGPRNANSHKAWRGPGHAPHTFRPWSLTCSIALRCFFYAYVICTVFGHWLSCKTSRDHVTADDGRSKTVRAAIVRVRKRTSSINTRDRALEPTLALAPREFRPHPLGSAINRKSVGTMYRWIVLMYLSCYNRQWTRVCPNKNTAH